jgi:hypothetical protein
MAEAQDHSLEQAQSTPWEASQYEAALAHLERLQEQVNIH